MNQGKILPRSILENALEVSSEGVCIVSPKTGTVVYSNPSCRMMFGFTHDSKPSAEQMLARIKNSEDLADSLSRPGEAFTLRLTDGYAMTTAPYVLMDQNNEEYVVLALSNLHEEEPQDIGTGNAQAAPLSDISHELRTPLNAIMGFSEIMKNEMFGPLGSPKYAEYLDSICKSSKDLLNTVDSLLEFTRLQSDEELMMEEEEADICELARASIHAIAQQHAHRKVEIACNMPREPVKCVVDAGIMEQALFCILSELMRITPLGHRLTIAVEITADGGVAISMANTANAEEKAHLPSEDYSPEMEYSALYAKCRLAFTLSRKYIEMHQGRLDVTSKFGEGLRVTMKIPAQRVVESLSSRQSPVARKKA